MERELTAELSNLCHEKEKLRSEYEKQELHESFQHRIIWTNCRYMIKDEKKEIEIKIYKDDSLWSKKVDMECDQPYIIKDMNNYYFSMGNILKRGYSKTEFQEAISYMQNYIDLYKENIIARKEFLAENYYSTFMQELQELVLLYDKSVKKTDRKIIKVTQSERENYSGVILDKLIQLIREKEEIIEEHKEVLRSPVFNKGKAWRICRDDIKRTIGLSNKAEKEDKYLPFMSYAYHIDFDNELWKKPKIVKDIERNNTYLKLHSKKYSKEYFKYPLVNYSKEDLKYPLVNYLKYSLVNYSKEDLLVAKKYMEQYLSDLEASIILAYELISSNYYGNFLNDLEVLVRKY